MHPGVLSKILNNTSVPPSALPSPVVLKALTEAAIFLEAHLGNDPSSPLLCSGHQKWVVKKKKKKKWVVNSRPHSKEKGFCCWRPSWRLPAPLPGQVPWGLLWPFCCALNLAKSFSPYTTTWPTGSSCWCFLWTPGPGLAPSHDLLNWTELCISQPGSEYINSAGTKPRNEAPKTGCFLWRWSPGALPKSKSNIFEESVVGVWNTAVIMKKRKGDRQ